MPDVNVDVHVGEGMILPLEPDVVEQAVRTVLRREDAGPAEISVALVGDDEIAGLNREYLSHEGPTDVISFPLSQPGAAVLVADIYVGVEQARRQAEDLGVPLAEELLRLAVHGTLHALGHDHPEGDDRESSEMYHRQEELLALILPESGGGAA